MTSSLQTPCRLYLPFRGVKNDDAAFLPLNPESKEIRCVILRPGHGNDPIECELVYTSISGESESRRPYVALSYCWGNTKDTVEIQLLGQSMTSSGACQQPISVPFRITRNLHTALTFLRNESKQCLWIDALCINQKDLPEKMHQVQSMGNIFSSAEAVLVWLGLEDKYSRFLMRAWTAHLLPMTKAHGEIMIMDLYVAMCENTHPFWTGLAEDEVLRQLALDLHEESVDMSSPGWYKKALWTSFERLFDRPWWSRIWVVQEVLLAPKSERGGRKVDLRIVDNVVSWEEMLDIILPLVHHLDSLPRNSEPATASSCDVIRYSWQHLVFRDEGNSDPGIRDLLVSTNKFNASDPRDKLFALLLLASDTRESFRQEPLICPDYTKSTKAVFDDLVSWEPALKGTWIWGEGDFVELTGDSVW